MDGKSRCEYTHELVKFRQLPVSESRDCVIAMKLAQGQIWKTSPDVHSNEGKSVYLRIVELERLSVTYKEMLEPKTCDGYHKSTSKKVFCKLIKRAELIGE